MRAQIACGIIVVMACSRPPRPAPLENTGAEIALTVTERGVGPIDASTPERLDAVRAALPGYDVTPLDHGGITVARGGEQMMYLLYTDGKLHSVHVTSARIAVEGKPFRVGQRFDAATRFELCQCGDDDDRPLCVKPGTRVAVMVQHACDMSPAQHVGAPVIEIVWAPHAFGD